MQRKIRIRAVGLRIRFDRIRTDNAVPHFDEPVGAIGQFRIVRDHDNCESMLFVNFPQQIM